MAASGPRMTQIAPLEAYREGILAISTARLGLRTGSLFALLFFPGMAAVSLWASPGRPIPWLLLAGVSLLAGALFGLLFPPGLKRSLLRTTEAVYRGEPPYSTIPPDARFEHSLPCSLMAGKLAVGGVLYLAPGLATFVPHGRNLPRHRTSVVIADGSGCAFRVLPSPMPRWVAAGGPLPGLLEAESPLGSWRLSVPRPGQMLPEIQRIVGLPGGGPA